MPFLLRRFLALRPFAYHLTDGANLGTIRRRRLLEPAADLLNRAGRPALIREHRSSSLPIGLDGAAVVLKDQRPLIFANAALAPGWTPADFIEHLNRHVFFWPGDEDGPVRYGERLFDRYAGDAPAILRVPTAALLRANPAAEPLFCPWNSGAPRMQAGRRVARGPDLFRPAAAFPRSAGDVVELVFRGPVRLPEEAETRTGRDTWAPLAAPATQDVAT